MKTALTQAWAQAQVQGSNFFSFSCACAYACVCAATSLRSVITQAQGYLPHVVMFGQSKHWIQITSRLNSFPKWRKARMILVVLVFASNVVFTWVISIACVSACVSAYACACVASGNQAQETHNPTIQSKLKANLCSWPSAQEKCASKSKSWLVLVFLLIGWSWQSGTSSFNQLLKVVVLNQSKCELLLTFKF